MSVFLFVDRDTALHRMHPVTKVMGLVLGFALALIFTHPVPALMAFVLALVALAAAGGLANLRRMWKFLLLLFVVTGLIWSLFLRVSAKGGTAAWALGLALSRQQVEAVEASDRATVLIGVAGRALYSAVSGFKAPKDAVPLPLFEVSAKTAAYGAAMGLRIVSCIVFGLAFLTCTRTEDFALGLRAMGAPHGVSVAVSLAFRLVPTLIATANNVIEAQQARGVDPQAGNPLRRFRNYIPLIAPVLAYALRSADMTAMALESRGLGHAPAHRTSYRQFEAGAADLVLLIGLATAVGLCLYARSLGIGMITFGA